MNHFIQLLKHIPDIRQRKVLDIGAGRGNFLLFLKKEGVDAHGVELNHAYIEQALSAAAKQQIDIDLRQGAAEDLPYDDNEFGFVNLSEVIEHVNEPEKVLTEVHRVLKDDGFVYISMPSRFSVIDPHYHLWFINWIPRRFSNLFATFFGKGQRNVKNAGAQTLEEMHYFTPSQVSKIMSKTGFSYIDIREKKIKAFLECSLLSSTIAVFLYRFLALFYFDTFHLILTKTKNAQ